jgi:hypothetical protein
MMNNKIKVGQEVCFVDVSVGRGQKTVSMQPVVRVGKKYFYLKPSHWEIKIDIETLREENNSNYKSYCFMTMQDYLDNQEEGNLSDYIASFYRNLRRPKLSLDQLRRIKAIMDETNSS